MKKVKVAVNGYGVIGKRVADALQLQDDMELVGVCDVISDWRIKMALRKDYPVYAFDLNFQKQMIENGVEIKRTLDDLIRVSEIIIDYTPKKIAAQILNTVAN